MQGAGHGFESEHLPSLLYQTYCDPLHARVYTLIFTKRNDKGIHFTSIQDDDDDDDDDDIAGSAFHFDRWALLNLANSLFRSIST